MRLGKNGPEKTKLTGITVLLAAVSAGLCQAQAGDTCQPSSLNIPEAKCPCVYPDHRSLLPVLAPDRPKSFCPDLSLAGLHHDEGSG